jgi:hypothetical protein
MKKYKFGEEYEEFDLLVSIAPIKNIPIGTDGTIVHKYNNENFEVEFFKDHKTLSVETVSKNQIKKI